MALYILCNNEFQNDINDIYDSLPIGKVQYYKSGRVVLIFNGKEYELLKANEDKHHKVNALICKFKIKM